MCFPEVHKGGRNTAGLLTPFLWNNTPSEVQLTPSFAYKIEYFTKTLIVSIEVSAEEASLDLLF